MRCHVPYSLDPLHDPVGILYSMDFYALQAKDGPFVMQAYEACYRTCYPKHPLIPNIMYGQAWVAFTSRDPQ